MCFGGRLMRGNRVQKVHSSFYQAFDSLSYPHLATLGVDVAWNKKALLQVEGVYRPRFEVRRCHCCMSASWQGHPLKEPFLELGRLLSFVSCWKFCCRDAAALTGNLVFGL